MKNKKKIALGAGALAVVMVAAGTFAWFTTTDKVENVFGMDNFDVTITEAFDKDDPIPLVPGTDVTKEVGVTNSGNVPVIVRVKLEETLSLLQMETGADPGDAVDKIKVVYEATADKSEKDGYVPVLISQEMITAYSDRGYNTYKEAQSEGNVPTEITVLRKVTTEENGENKNANTVYSYLAYKVVAESDPALTYNHLVKLTPGEDTDTDGHPDSFTVEYAYNMYKDASDLNNQNDAVGGKTGLTVTHGKGDAELDKYYDADGPDTFHKTGDLQKPYAVELNFADKVQTDGTVLGKDTVWYLAEDGYFYYTKALDGTSISEPLLKSVSISKTAGNAFKGATYTITPVMEAVQMEHAAVAAAWKDLADYAEMGPGAVSSNDASGIKQMISNIIKSENHEGYYTATGP